MTPINPAASGGLPAYAAQDVAASNLGAAPLDPAYVQSIDPSQPGYYDPYAVDPYAANAYADTYSSQYADPYAAAYEGVDPAAYGSAVAGSQPAVTGPATAAGPVVPSGVTATVDDFAALGIFTEPELQQLSQMGLAPEELGQLYAESVAYMQSPEFAQQQAQVQAQAGGTGDPNAAAVPGAGQAAPAGEPAWNKAWDKQFRAMMDAQGLDSQTQLMVVASLRQSGLDEATLTQALEYYANTPEGKAELTAINDQVEAGNRQGAKMMIGMGLGALGIAGAAAGFGASRGNLVRALERSAAGNGANAVTAGRALDAIRDGKPLTTSMRLDIERAMRAEANATNRALHPIRKAQLNGAARHVTPSMKLSGRELVERALFMKNGDVTSDMHAATRAASTAPKAGAEAAKEGAKAAGKVVGGGGVADDVVRGAANGADDAARGAASAAKTAGSLGKVGRALGPIGLIASAGLGIWGISKTVEAEGGFGKESAKMTGNVSGGIAGGVAGAAAGAAIGSVVPVLGTGIGAVVGGIVGGLGGGEIGEKIGGFLHGLFD